MTGHHAQELNATRAPLAEAQAREQQVLLRLGAICAIVGPLILFASFAEPIGR
jgi:hypothetical protein